MHIDFLRLLDRRDHSPEPTHRAQANVQVQLLPQRDVQRADTASDGRGQRPFDADPIVSESLHRLLRQPTARYLVGFLAGQHLFPLDLPAAAVGFPYRRVHDTLHDRRDFGADSVSLDKGNLHRIGHVQSTRSVHFDLLHYFVPNIYVIASDNGPSGALLLRIPTPTACG